MERTITINENETKLIVTVDNARMIDIINANGQVIESVKSEEITAPQIFYLQPGEYQIVTDGQIENITTQSAQAPPLLEFERLLLTSDAKDFHVVDGIGEIPADGQSFTTITIRKLNSLGTPLQREEDNDEIFIRTSAGIIKDNQGNEEIREMNLSKGEGLFRLYSEEHKRVATVQAITANPYLADAILKIEFI